jgi:linoleoyl-CoA desaturase
MILIKAPITFSRERLDFSSTLNQRVNSYFKDNHLSKHANTEMVIKTVCMFSLYIVPYVLIVTQWVSHPLLLLLSVMIMSIGLSGIGLSVMHDANHGAYAKRNWINILIGYSLNFVGANAFNWKMQHNVLHHTYTNVYEEDEDISPRGILRMTPHSPWRPMHRFQHIYAWFFYGLMTIAWMVAKDFMRMKKYHQNGLVKKHKANITNEWLILIATKLFYLTYIFLVPLFFTPLPWWQILIGIFTMHFIAGFVLAIIFQPAHVIDSAEFPMPNDDNMLENNWAIHQLLTTTNFGNRSRWFSWYVGGLNFQIEHHLFPTICHVHYRKLASIVKSTAEEFSLPYKSTKTFFAAIVGHARLMKQLGQRPV